MDFLALLGSLWPILLVGLLVLVVLFAVSRFAKVYRIVPPDVALIITGGRGKTRIVTGGATFVWPILNQAEELSLGLMLVEKSQDAVKTKSGMTVLIDWFAQVRFRTDEESLRTAARLFLRKSRDQIQRDIEAVLSGNVRAIAGDLTVEQMHNDRDAFIEKVQMTAEDELKDLGVEVILGIQEITDNDGYFEALAGPSIANAKKEDRIAQAEADRVAGIAEEESRQAINQRRIDADREILAQEEALALRKVEMGRNVDIQKANADKEVNDIRVISEQRKQEADKLVPARAAAEAIEINANAKSKEITALANANAHAKKETGEAEAQALEANLLAEARGKRELAEAMSAQDSVNLVLPLAELLAKADVQKASEIAKALANIGENVKVWDFSGGVGGENTITKLMNQITPMVLGMATQVEALTGESAPIFLARLRALVKDPEVLLALSQLAPSDSSSKEMAQEEVEQVDLVSDQTPASEDPMSEVKPPKSSSKKTSKADLDTDSSEPAN